MTGAVVVAALTVAGMLLWPARRLPAVPTPAAAHLRRVPGWAGAARLGALWRTDPVLVLRSRRRRGVEVAEEAATSLLDAVAPALRAGLSPQHAFAAALSSGRGAQLSAVPGGVELVEALTDPDRLGTPLGGVFAGWAAETGSEALAFVAGAWRLSEDTGAPLADAVERANAQLRAAASRRRRVAAAVAGPRATVTVLTTLPALGPLLAWASGVGLAELYLGSVAATGSLLAGVGLMIAGRAWCRWLVRSAVGG